MHEKLQAYMAKCGLPSSHVDLNLDGTIHRYGKEGPQDDKAEWYIGFELDNGEIYCSFGSWSHDQEKHTYKSWNDNNPHAEKYLEQAKILREKQLEEERHAAKQALEYTSKVWDAAPLASHEHPYLRRKKVKAHGIKTHQGKLLIPRYDSTGTLASVQTIATDGLKKNAAGLTCKSTYFVLGERENPNTIRFCEGYATAATLFEQTGDMTVACFSCGNIFGSTFLLREKYPSASLVLNADKKTEKLCEKWKQQYGGEVQVPKDCEGSDFNDLFNEKGKKQFDNQTYIDRIITCTPSLIIKKSNERPPREMIFHSTRHEEVHPIIFKGTSTLVYGAGGAGKSMFSMEKAFAMAYGQSFMCWKTDRPRKVLLIDTEMDIDEAAERMLEIIIRRNLEEENGFLSCYNLCVENLENKKRRAINLYSQQTRNLLDEQIQQNEVIIIDNLQNCTRDTEHEGKENSSSAWFVIHDWMKAWQDQGKTFFVVHHENRAGGYRGTSRLDGDFDNRIRISAPETMPEEGFQLVYCLEKGRGIRQIHLKKETSAHRISTYKRSYGWKIEDVPPKKK